MFAIAGETLEPVANSRKLRFGGHDFHIIGEAALFWPEMSALLVADLHLEKGSAFARTGQMLPPYDSLATLQALETLIRESGARRVICLGDNFHDDGGPTRLSGEAALLLRRMMADYRWTWIVGNHDSGLSVEPIVGGEDAEYIAELALGDIILRHDVKSSEDFEISGHFHPKYRISAKGRMQSRRCFVRYGNRLIMPAFGSYAGGMDAGELVRILGEMEGSGEKVDATAIVAHGRGLAQFPLG